MRKISWILIVFILCIGCSVVRKQKGNSDVINFSTGSGNIIQSIVNQNITKKSFFIEKAEFRIVSGGGGRSGIGTIKFIVPDKYLISIKSNAGIEIARIYLTEDSIVINDRLNKKLYYGSASDLKKKFGLTTSILPVILGDYVNNEKVNEGMLDCSEGKINIDAIIKDIKIRYIVDCKYGKSIMTSPVNDRNSSGMKIEYSNFFRSDGINIPGLVEISEKQNNTRIQIKIQRIVIPWEGSIEFIPGKQYEKIHLL